jgi:hypothetical protein
MKLHRVGGFAAIVSVCAYAALRQWSILTQRQLGDLSDPAKAIAAYLASPIYLHISALLLMACYVLFLVTTFALYERMRTGAPWLTRLMLIAASIAAVVGITEGVVLVAVVRRLAVSTYMAHSAIINGLYMIGGWAYLFVGCSIVKTRAFARILGWLFVLTGILWIPRFMLPQLGMLPAFLSCVAVIWVGIELIRQKWTQPAAKEMGVSR